MQKFGIEIRRSGTLSGLYKDVDSVLSQCGMADGGVSDTAKVATVAHSLQKMLNADSYFSACTITNCANVCQVCISRERMSVYNAAHCIQWNEMMPDYRMMLVAMVLDDFRAVLNPLT